MPARFAASPDESAVEQLVGTVERFVNENAPNLATSYTWKIPSKRPVEFDESANLADSNIRLREALSKKWRDKP